VVAALLLTVVWVELPKTAATALPSEQEEPLTGDRFWLNGSVQIQEDRNGRGMIWCLKLRAFSS